MILIFRVLDENQSLFRVRGGRDEKGLPCPEQRENAFALEELHMLSAKVNLTLQWESMGTQEKPSQFPLIFYLY